MSFGKSKQSSSSAPLTANQVATYYGKVDELSGGALDDYAKRGTAATAYTPVSRADLVKPGTVNAQTVAYNAPTADNVKALGGLGATRAAEIERMRQSGRSETAADPSLSVFQKTRVNQLSDQDSQDRLDAIKKETEAAIAGMVSESAGRDLTAQTTNAGNNLNAQATNADNTIRAGSRNLDTLDNDARNKYIADAANASLTREDLDALARIFFGGAGNSSSSSGRSFNLAFANDSGK